MTTSDLERNSRAFANDALANDQRAGAVFHVEEGTLFVLLARRSPFVAPELFECRAIQVDESLEAVGQIPVGCGAGIDDRAW
jgi:hypothetical protein